MNSINLFAPGKRKSDEEIPLPPFELQPSSPFSLPVPSFGLGSLAGRASRPVPARPLVAPSFFAFNAPPTPSRLSAPQCPPTKAPRRIFSQARLSHAQLLGPWGNVQRWEVLKNEEGAPVTGDIMQVYFGNGHILKFPRVDRALRTSEADLIEEAVRLGKLFAEKGFPIAEILNEGTAIQEQRLIMEYFPETLTAIPEHLIPQYKELLQKAWDENLCIDIKPRNLAVKDGKLVLFDWVTDEDSVACAIRTSITRANVANPRDLAPTEMPWIGD